MKGAASQPEVISSHHKVTDGHRTVIPGQQVVARIDGLVFSLRNPQFVFGIIIYGLYYKPTCFLRPCQNPLPVATLVPSLHHSASQALGAFSTCRYVLNVPKFQQCQAQMKLSLHGDLLTRICLELCLQHSQPPPAF